MSSQKQIVVYFLQSGNRSYIGYTVNMIRRFRQHSGQLVGGARYTSKWSDVTLIANIGGFTSKKEALSFEWFAKRPCRVKYPNCHHRLYGFFKPLLLKKFSKLNLSVNLFKHPELAHQIQEDFRIEVNLKE